MKLALVLYAARYLADHPKRMRSFRQAVAPIAVVAGPACLLIVVEPDLGTTLVVALHDRRAADRGRACRCATSALLAAIVGRVRGAARHSRSRTSGRG